MVIRGLCILTFLLLLRALATAEEQPFSTPLYSPPFGAVNVVQADFGNGIGGGDYGLANIEPIEVSPRVGQGDMIRIVRTAMLGLSHRNEARFQVLLGETKEAYCWIESLSPVWAWRVVITALLPDGYSEPVFNQDMLPTAQYYLRVPPRALLEFRVTPRAHSITLNERSNSSGGASIARTALDPSRVGLNRQFQFTISPTGLMLWQDFKQIPFTYDRGVITPP